MKSYHTLNQKIMIFFYINSKKNYAHVYWNGKVDKRILFSIKSFLFKAKSNWILYFWLRNISNIENDAKNELKKLKICIKIFNWNFEIIDTPFMNLKNLFNSNFPTFGYSKISVESDWIRNLLMYKYGGVYFDIDTYFIWPIDNIIKKYGEFVTQWACSSEFTNTNFMHFKKKGKIISNIIKEIQQTKRPHSFFGLKSLNSRSLKKCNVSVLTCCQTDVCWGCLKCETFRWIFKPINEEISKLIKKINNISIIYHWHNGYKLQIHKTSFFNQMEKKFDSFFDL